MLNELDKELEKRGHKFVRYADDGMILCKSRRSAERTLASIIPFIEKKLFLKVNREKTIVAHISKVKYLGYGFYRYKEECRFKVHKKSLAKMKKRLRAITNRSKAISNEESQDEIPNDKAVQPVKVEGTRTGQLPKRDMESGINAEPNSNE